MSDTSLCEVSDLTVVVCEALCQILCYAIPWPVSNGTAELSQILRYAKYLTCQSWYCEGRCQISSLCEVSDIGVKLHCSGDIVNCIPSLSLIEFSSIHDLLSVIFHICIDVDILLSVVINDRSLNQITYHNEILDFDISFLNFDRLNIDFDTKCHIHYNEIFG